MAGSGWERETRIAAQVAAAYPAEWRPERIEFLGSAGGFSGASFWRFETRRGQLCLRRWPREHPTQERLQWIHAVVGHIAREGFHNVPVPLETQMGATYVDRDDGLWQLEPWLPGSPDRSHGIGVTRLRAALVALARLHRAAATFPIPSSAAEPSPGIAARRQRLAWLCDGGARRLAAAIQADVWPELELRAGRLFDFFWQRADTVDARLAVAAQRRVPLQPCLRDVWSEHILFAGSQVTGVIDFGAMRIENVAADVSRLLGSVAGSDQRAWHTGLNAYESVRPLSAAERDLVEAFDQSGSLLAGIQWLEWVYVDGRQFDDRAAILARIDRLLARLGHV